MLKLLRYNRKPWARPKARMRVSSLRHLRTDQFFNNAIIDQSSGLIDRQDVDQQQIRVKDIVQSIPLFVNSRYEVDDIKLERTGLVGVREDVDLCWSESALFEELLHSGNVNVPAPGSVIEFLPWNTENAQVGVVLEGCSAKFNENFNRLTVLTAGNEIVYVSPQDITLHLFSVIRRNHLHAAGILTSRHLPEYGGRIAAVEMLSLVIDQAHRIRDFLKESNQFDLCYSQFQSQFNVVPVSMLDFVSSIHKLPVGVDWDNAFNQGALIIACHLEMMSDPSRWVVPTACRPNRISNVSAADGCSNNLATTTVYLANSLRNHDSISELVKNSKSELYRLELRAFLKSLTKSQADESTRKVNIDLTLYFTLWEGAKYKFFIDILKFYLIYPHTKLQKVIEQYFEDASVSNVYLILNNDLKIYTDGYGETGSKTSDIFLSASILGETNMDQVAISSPKDLNNTRTKQISHLNSDSMVDHFPHLRDSKRFYKDLTIFSIDEGRMGISIEKSNVRKYLINIHVQDPATKIEPNSPLFESLTQDGLRSTLQLSNGAIKIFDSKFLQKLQFVTQNVIHKNEISVGDLNCTLEASIEYPNESIKTCMTVSFAYFPYSNDPFNDLRSKVRISFDDISDLQVKSISNESLENILLGNSESNSSSDSVGGGGFRFFKRRTIQENQTKSLLSDRDEHDIRFIYNITKTYSKVRNLNGASLIDSTRQEYISEFKSPSNKLSHSFERELKLLSEDLAAHYCFHNNIPVYTSRQGILPAVKEEEEEQGYENDQINLETMFKKPQISKSTLPIDEVFLTHNNLMLPEFFATSYFQTLLCRDSYGELPTSASVSSKNFLGFKEVSVMEGSFTEVDGFVDPLIPEGFLLGSVNVKDSQSNFMALMNQYQILCYIHLLTISKLRNLLYAKRFSYLQGLGYPTEALGSEMLFEEIPRFGKEFEFQKLFQHSHKKYWKLKELELNLMRGTMDGISFNCVITYICQSDSFLPNKLTKAYCVDLGIEIELLVNSTRSLTVGSFIECDRVLYLNPVTGLCILSTKDVI